MCEAVEMSAAYVYATRDDPVEHTVTDVERVKVDNGVIVFRGRKKRTLLVMNEHTFMAAWRADSVRMDPGGERALAVEVNLRQINLVGVDNVEVETSKYLPTSYYVLGGDDDDLPIAVLSSTGYRTIAAVQ